MFNRVNLEQSGGLNYHGIRWRSRKNPPVGPLSGRVASHTGVSAPCATLRGACLPPMSVLTHPGQAELTRILDPRVTLANRAVIAFNNVFEIRYAGTSTPHRKEIGGR